MLVKKLLATVVCIILLSSTVYAADWTYKNDTWYCDEQGWVQSGDDWYYVDSSGRMLVNTYIDGYYLSYTGRMINESKAEREVNNLLSRVLRGEDATWELTSNVHEYSIAAAHKDVKGGIIMTGTIAVYSLDNVARLKNDREYIDIVLRPYINQLVNQPVSERILNAHNIVCGLIDYSTETNVATALREKKGACHVYTMLYKYLMNAVGIDCDYVTGTALGQFHAWNKVHVGDKSYIVDCCWDDSLGDYTYFMQESLGDRKEK